MKKRNLDWFYDSKGMSLSKFSPYLELYYQLFKKNFTSTSDIESRYSLLCWIFSQEVECKELSRVLESFEILSILDEVHDQYEIISGSKFFLTKFHYYYYVRNKSILNDWGFNLGTNTEKQKYLIWCYTWGLDTLYFKLTLERMLEPSKCFTLKNFEISKIFESIISGYELLEEKITDQSERLALGVAKLLFNYSRFKYPLSNKQLLQLASLDNFNYFFDLHEIYYKGQLSSLDFSEIDMSPAIQDILKITNV